MVQIDQSELAGKIRDRPISKDLEFVLRNAAIAAGGIDKVGVTSGGQPGSTGRTTGSTRHNGGRAADLYLEANGNKISFTDRTAPDEVKRFITACAANGALGMGAGVQYMGKQTMHIGFGKDRNDNRKIVWGKDGRSANAPDWLKESANEGWFNPPDWVFQDGPEDLPEDGDEVFDEGGPTEAITDIPPRFTEEVIRGAQASQRMWGIPTSVTLAQWALESGYGASMPPGSNNPFGIKARAGEPSVTASTTEFIDGKNQKVKAAFRAFPDMASAFIQHSRLLGTAGVYAPARRFINDPDKFADALTGVYATDPNYGSKLKSIMRSNDLYRFDLSADKTSGLAQIHTNVERVAELQQQLRDLGFNPGGIDGKFGPLTAGAVAAFQKASGIPVTSVFDEKTLVAINAAGGTDGVPDLLPTQEKELLPVLLALIEILNMKKKDSDMASESGSETEIIKNLIEQISGKPKKKEVGPVNGWLGQTIGRVLNGRKTATGILGLIGTVLLPGLFPSAFGPILELFSLSGEPGATGGQTLLQWAFGLLTTWGIAGKIEKAGDQKET